MSDTVAVKIYESSLHAFTDSYDAAVRELETEFNESKRTKKYICT